MLDKLIKIYVKILVFLPVLMVLESFIGIIATLTTFLFLAIPIMINLLSKENIKRVIIKYILIIICFIVSSSISNEIKIHEVHIKSLLLVIVNLDILSSKKMMKIIKNEMQINIKNMEIFIVINLFINVIFAVLPTGYSEQYSQAWGLKAYCGIYDDPHQFAYRTSGILMMILYIVSEKKQNRNLDYIISVIFTMLVLTTGARVPTLMSLIIEFFIIFTINIKVKIKNLTKTQILMTILLAILLAIIIIVSLLQILKQTTFFQKMLNSTTSSGFDNGREDLREVDLLYYNNSETINKIFGSGAEKTYNIHLKYMGVYIWSHNDFFQILISFGLPMTIYYGIMLLGILRDTSRKNKLIKILFIFGLFFIAFFNGLYIHPRFVVAIIFWKLALINKNKKERDELKKDEEIDFNNCTIV